MTEALAAAPGLPTLAVGHRRLRDYHLYGLFATAGREGKSSRVSSETLKISRNLNP